MAVRQTGCAMFATGSAQEIMDMAVVIHLSAIKSRVLFVHLLTDPYLPSSKIEQLIKKI